MAKEKIYTDSTGLTTFWDDVNKCYTFEESDGSSLSFTITPQSGNAETDGFSGPTIEALIAAAHHRLSSYQSFMPCEENRQALFGLKLALESLDDRAKRIAQELGVKTDVGDSIS